jgi:hypothetical protein
LARLTSALAFKPPPAALARVTDRQINENAISAP